MNKLTGPLMMCSHALFLAAVYCGAVVCHAAAEQPKPEESGISVSLYQWETRKFQRESLPSGHMQFAVHLNVRNGSDWNVAYCEENRAALKIRDARGRMCSGQQYQYGPSFSMPGSRKTGVFTVFTKSWLPSPAAAWFQVEGSIPFAVSRTFSMSEGVVLKQNESGAVPLVLRGAAMDGGDVEVRMSIKEDMRRKKGGREYRWFSIRLDSPVKIGCMGFEVHGENGMLLPVDEGDQVMIYSGKEYSWKRLLAQEILTGKEWRVSVKYATGLKKILVPVDIRSGLFGVEGERKSDQRKD